tara:strand:- start:321 stop:719 length:399 start_codon:yes stop_codon:yes gene_type:complete
MIHISTHTIDLKSSSQELFEFLSHPEKMAEIISFKKTKHVEVREDTITFILKWAARFNFTITSVTKEYVLIESTENVEFSTAIRFDIEEEKNGSSVVVHIETDTSPIIDITFEGKVKTWIEAIINNLEKKFG